ncbi:MAG: Mur ligase domain-containing protein, partial [Acidimicrobiales bacterium]
MRWTLSELALAAGGTIVGGSTAVVDAIATDSRRLHPGQAFVALRAERDGHDFLEAAAEAGAAAAVVEAGRGAPEGLPAIEVVETGEALLAIGAVARSRLIGPVVGITGSVGKTSTKDLTAAALSAAMRVAS